MSNYDKLEKSKGVLAFANNTETVDYEYIGQRALQLAEHYLGVPTKLITGQTAENWNNHRVDIDSNQTVQWNNFNRYQAWELSPWDETIVIDVDYLVTTNKLNILFGSAEDLVLCHNNTMLHGAPSAKPALLPVWATVFYFRKTPRTKEFFDLVGRIQRNWSYYRLLFNVMQANYRNDYAFAMAEKILSGYTTTSNTRMPFGITTANGPLKSMSINNEWLVVRAEEHADVLPRQDIHVMSKQWLQSEQFDDFINQVLDND